MDLKIQLLALFYGLRLLAWQAFQAASAAANISSPPLNCTVTILRDGAFLYQLSQPHSSTCTLAWEDRNKTVIAHDFDRDGGQVQSMTNQSITMKNCYDYLYFTQNCAGVYDETSCIFNCSLLEQRPLAPTGICFNKAWCVNRLTFGLIIMSIVIVVLVCLCLPFWKKCKKRRVEKIVFYKRADDQGEIEPKTYRMMPYQHPPIILPAKVFS